MKVHEYQAKEIFSRYGIPVPRGFIASTPEQASQFVRDLGGRAIVKAQVHAGGRGRGGGIKMANSPQDASDIATTLLGSNLITPQTGPEGVPVNQVLIEEPVDISRELYLATTLDRTLAAPVLLASPAGGMDIEEVAPTHPEDIHAESIDPLLGLMEYQTRRLARDLGLSGPLARAAGSVMSAVARISSDLDCSLVEINPLVVTSDDRIVALDAKINIEDDALFRHTELRELRDPSQEDPLEAEAAALDIAYVSLDGDVGCLINGAGLAMATLDLAKSVGAAPANFLDVGGGATEEKVASAVKLIISDPKVTRVLINLFGGILRCEVAARGVVQAFEETGSRMPLIVRLLGTNMEEGLSIFQESGLPVTFAETLADVSEAVRPAR
jgi:succinyl-CoA synthetase beta subunit